MDILRKRVNRRWFAFLELFLIAASAVVWMVKPDLGILFSLLALAPFVIRIAAGHFHFTFIDGLVIVFAITAWVGYWAAYDPITAWKKAWLLMTAALFYFSFKEQPKANLVWISIFFSFIGIGVSIYYFLSQDFVAAPRKLALVNQLGRWIMDVRPQTGLVPIHPNYVAGIVVITIPFFLHPLFEFKDRGKGQLLSGYSWVVFGGLLAGFTLLMTTSRGAFLALLSGAGIWILWRFTRLNGSKFHFRSEALFKSLLFIVISAVILFLFLGPAQSGSVTQDNYHFGNGSRAELFSRSIYLLLAYPITGGGLGSFPGLYSHYLLDIPFFNVSNSHNLFLDVAIEQGLLGGFSFLFLYIASLWVASDRVVEAQKVSVFQLCILFSLVVVVVHGMVDNYLYNGNGSVLSLSLVGMAMNGRWENSGPKRMLNLRTVGTVSLAGLVFVIANPNLLPAMWYANLGAVQAAKVELDGFPNNGWTSREIVPRLSDADRTLRTSLRFAPDNRTANQRLGLILMDSGDFHSAVEYLARAYQQAPDHRGIVKALGYCYVWLGEMDKAAPLLSQIPESQEELDVYIWWWSTQGRTDLSQKASFALQTFGPLTGKP